MRLCDVAQLVKQLIANLVLIPSAVQRRVTRLRCFKRMRGTLFKIIRPIPELETNQDATNNDQEPPKTQRHKPAMRKDKLLNRCEGHDTRNNNPSVPRKPIHQFGRQSDRLFTDIPRWKLRLDRRNATRNHRIHRSIIRPQPNWNHLAHTHLLRLARHLSHLLYKKASKTSRLARGGLGNCLKLLYFGNKLLIHIFVGFSFVRIRLFAQCVNF